MKLLMLFLLTLQLFSLQIDQIQSIMQKNIQTSLQILKQPNKNINQVAQEIFSLFDSIFDYELMAKLSLSQYYDTLSQEQKQNFNQAFESNIKKSFTNKLKLYTNQDLKVIDGQLLNPTRYQLKTSLIVNGREDFIVFKFYNHDNDWKIYDVNILGVSIIQTYRSEFADTIKTANFQALIQKLSNEMAFEAH